MKKQIIFLSIIILFIVGCTSEIIPTEEVIINNKQEVSQEIQAVTQSFPGYSFYLPVPFKAQVLPGDWSNTKNCGQTCVVMLAGYLNNSAVNVSQITAQNTWLYNYTGNSSYNDANGYYTSANQLQTLLNQKHGLSSSILYGTSLDDVLSAAYSGKPCIVNVKISGETLVSSSGVDHWALLVGYDGTNVVVNDPGTSYGNGKLYSAATFLASWTAGNKLYMPVSD